jgi:hypothetical protein
LIDDEKLLDTLGEQARAHHEEFGKQQAEKARTSLKGNPFDSRSA